MIRFLRLAALAALTASMVCNTALAQDTGAPPTADGNSAMGGELMYQLLLGELNAIGGEPGVAYSLLLDAARKSGDERLFKRASDIALQNRSGESALQAARAWRTALPESREGNRYLLQILIGLNRPTEALEPLKRELAFDSDAERTSALIAIPRLFARATDKKAAAGLVEQAVTPYLGSPVTGPAAWTTVGRMRLDADDRAGALEAAQKAQALDAMADGPAILAVSLMGLKMPQAEAVLRKYLQGKPRVEVRMDYARALIGAQRYEEAAAQLAAVTTEKPDNAAAWLIKGSLEQQNRQFPAADASLRRYVQLQSGAASTPEAKQALTQAYVRLSEIAVQGKDYTAAQGWLNRIDDSDEMLNVQSLRAAILAREGKLAEGRALIQAVPEDDASDARRKLSAEVQLLRENKEYRAAYDLIKAGLANHPLDVDLMYDQAMLAEKLGELDEMERLLRLAIAAKPDYHHAYNALGYSLADRGVRLPEARQLVRKALEFAPEDPFISDSLAWVEFRSGNLPEALRILQKAFKDKPDAEIAAHLGEVLWAMGNQKQAVSVWNEGLSLNAENETLVGTMKRLNIKP